MQSDEWHLARVDLPAQICRDIGRIVLRCGLMENYVQGIIYMLCNVDDRIGRVAIREPKLGDRLEIVSDLCALLGLKEPTPNIIDFRDAVQDAMDFRNLCAHGAWSYSQKHNGWLVQLTKGKWAGEKKINRVRHKKILRPQGQIINAEIFSEYIKNLDGIIEELKTMGDELQKQLEPSLQKQKSP